MAFTEVTFSHLRKSVKQTMLEDKQNMERGEGTDAMLLNLIG